MRSIDEPSGCDVGGLESADYRRIFDVLEACDQADSITHFGEFLTESISRAFGIKHVTFFKGDSLVEAFDDDIPLTTGDRSHGQIVNDYLETWRREDIFASVESVRMLESGNVVSVDQVAAGSSPYLHQYLYKWDIRSAHAMCFDLANGRSGLVGFFDTEPGSVRPNDIAALGLLRRRLPSATRHLESRPVAHTQREDLSKVYGLNDRQKDIVELVSRGMSNAAIGRTLCLAEDTVKKYVSRILAVTGCASRTELAVTMTYR